MAPRAVGSRATNVACGRPRLRSRCRRPRLVLRFPPDPILAKPVRDSGSRLVWPGRNRFGLLRESRSRNTSRHLRALWPRSVLTDVLSIRYIRGGNCLGGPEESARRNVTGVWRAAARNLAGIGLPEPGCRQQNRCNKDNLTLRSLIWACGAGSPVQERELSSNKVWPWADASQAWLE